MKFLFHVDNQNVEDHVGDIDTYIIPPGKAFRIENDFHANKVIEHKGPHHGIVMMNEIPSDDGSFKLDFEDAKHRATENLREARKWHVENYVRTQLEDRVAAGKPALMPQGTPARIIKEEGIDLGTEYNLFPAGMKSKVNENEEKMKLLEAQNSQQAQQIAALMNKMEELTKALQ